MYPRSKRPTAEAMVTWGSFLTMGIALKQGARVLLRSISRPFKDTNEASWQEVEEQTAAPLPRPGISAKRPREGVRRDATFSENID